MKQANLIFWLLIFLFSCASPITPSGGVKDTEPPSLEVEMPKNGMVNYTGNRIELLFDEYITFLNGTEKVIITPAMPSNPKFIVKGKKLLISLPEGLSENTTYTISLIDAVKDFHEGNTLSELKYVFSTGPFLDSASISGSVVFAENLQPVNKALIGLYKATDSLNITTNRPDYVVKSNSAGYFYIANIKNGVYNVVAFDDKNQNYLFDSNESLSMPTSLIEIEENTILEKSLIFFENDVKTAISSYKVMGNNKVSFAFNKEIETVLLDIDPYTKTDLVFLSNNNDSMHYYWSDNSIDKLTFYFNFNNTDRDTVELSTKLNKRSYQLDSGNNLVEMDKPLMIQSPLPIVNVFAEKIKLLDTDGKTNDLSVTFGRDVIEVNCAKNAEQQLTLIVDSGAIAFFNGDFNNKYKSVIQVVENSDKSSLMLSLINTTEANPVILLMNSDGVIVHRENIAAKTSISITNLAPGDYYIKVFDDSDFNIKWTTGSFELNRAPERTLFYSKPIEIKQNWDKEISITF